MKIAIPTDSEAGLDAAVSDGFGQCRKFAIVTLEKDAVHPAVRTLSTPGGGSNVFVLLGERVEVAIVGRVTETERQTIAGAGIRVFVRASGTVREALKAYQAGKLEESSRVSSCEGGSHG